MKTTFGSLIALGWLLVDLVQGHTVITYPGWRGNNLITNDTFPFGMQWNYPCGGLDVTQNRTYWPISSGGTLAVQPGWFMGHESALMYVNIGLGEEPANFTTVMVPRFHLSGPTNEAYDGDFCLRDIPLPDGVEPSDGDSATIQLVQAAQHGGALFNCVDVIFTDDESEIPPVTDDNCFNTSTLTIEAVKLETDSSSITDPSTSAATSSMSDAHKMLASVSVLVAILFMI